MQQKADVDIHIRAFCMVLMYSRASTSKRLCNHTLCYIILNYDIV